MNNLDFNYWINKLNLQKHPEGGFFKEVYRSSEILNHSFLPERYSTDRTFCTSIYFLLTSEEPSHFHKLHSDEIWNFYYGNTISLHLIDSEGEYRLKKLGMNFEDGENFQIIVPKYSWFGASIDKNNSYGLVGCTLAPGFEYDDFELISRQKLLELYPKYQDIIIKLTRE